MRIQTVQSHGKSLNIEGESAEFTGTEQYPERTTSGRLTTNKLPRAGLQPPALVSEKSFLPNPSKVSAPRGLAARPLSLYFRPPRDEAAGPATPRRAQQPGLTGGSGSAPSTDIASARCAGSGREKAAAGEGALGRRPLQESHGKDDRKERDAPHTEQASSASESLCAGAPDLAFLPEMMQH